MGKHALQSVPSERAAVIIFVPLVPFCRPVYLRVWELQMKVAAAAAATVGMLVCPVVVLRLSRDPDSVQTQGDPKHFCYRRQKLYHESNKLFITPFRLSQDTVTLWNSYTTV